MTKNLQRPSNPTNPVQSVEKWEQAFDALTDHVMILDSAGTIVWTNRAIRDQVQPRIGPLVGHHYRTLYYGTTIPKNPPPWETVLAGALSAVVETQFPSMPGDFLVSCYPLFDSHGIQWGAISVVKDITERKRIDETLRKIAQSDPAPGSMAFLRFLVRDLCQALNVPYAILAELESPSQPLTQTVAIWSNGNFRENMPWAPPPAIFEELLKVKGCHGDNLESPLFPPDSPLSSWSIISYLGTALRGRTGQIIGLLLVFSPVAIRNIHVAQSIIQLFAARAAGELQRKKAEDALRDSEQRYRAIVEHAYDLIIETTATGKCHYVTPNCQKVLGYGAGDMLGKSFFDFVHPEERGPLSESFHSHLKALQEIDMVCRLQTKQSEWRWFESHIHPFRTSIGTIVGVIVTRDITEWKRLEEERLRATKLESVGLLAGGIAHDFNNILTSVFANIGLAKMVTAKHMTPYGEKVIERLEAAEKACLRARDLTKQLLTFAKGGAPVKSTTSVASIITDTIQFALRGSDVRCTTHLPEDLWPVEVDEGQISQVIQNLVINGDQAMPDGGTISVIAKNSLVDSQTSLPLKPGKYVCVSVADQGIGIPDDHLQKIFDPYFTTKQKGSGLGLATTYSIMKRHGGHVAVTSSLGTGTCFTLYLPASISLSTKNDETSESLVQGTGRILVMDDEEDIQDVLGKMLEHLGFEVDFADDGSKAVALYTRALQEGNPYVATILDLTIPGGMGGKETLRLIKDHDPAAKVIVSSGYSNDPVMAQAGQFGFSGFIAKPYNLLDLSKVLTQIL
ncbi:MAG: PAS domain S-box protein [Nitrospirales bacterium]|nr:PAS domain S-box protein [Nitrospirales bacterium]